METYPLIISQRDTNMFLLQKGKKNIQNATAKPQKRRCPSTRCLWQMFNIIQGRIEMYVCWLVHYWIKGVFCLPILSKMCAVLACAGRVSAAHWRCWIRAESSICFRLHLFGGVCARACARLSLRLPGWVIRSCLLHHACFNISR